MKMHLCVAVFACALLAATHVHGEYPARVCVCVFFYLVVLRCPHYAIAIFCCVVVKFV